MLEAIAIALLLLVVGDFLSTFCYHIPTHVFGQLHLQTHHSSKQSFRHYAILTFNVWVLLDGILGALPYLLVSIPLWNFSPLGVGVGLLIGQLHVWWRHVGILGWHTRKRLELLCQMSGITTPERHWLHHQNTNLAFGDIFSFFERPAKAWLRWLRRLRRYWHIKQTACSSR